MKQQDDWRLTEAVDHELGRGDPFAAAIRGTRMPMVITDPRLPDNPIVFVNAAFQTLTGYDRDEIVGRNCRFLQGPDTDPAAIRAIREAVATASDLQVDLLNYRKDGTTFWNALFLSPVRGEDGEVQFFFASQLDVTDRVEAHSAIARQQADTEAEVSRRTEALQRALEEKDILLHEVDHRVKNNLTMIGSLLRLQARTLEDARTRETLNSMLERVDALATVHRRLYQSTDIARFDVGALVETIVSDMVGSTGRGDIRIEADIAPVHIASAHASSLGLIVNEILTNAIKHACQGRGCTLTVRVRAEGAEGLITVADDGPGMSPDAIGGLGRTLIARLSKQVRATTEWRSLDPGTEVRIVFEAEA